MVTMMAQNITSNMQGPSRHRRTASSLPPSSPPRDSSPPPAVQDELTKFLQAFGIAKDLSNDCIAELGDQLQAVHYTPDTISETSLPFERLQELTKLPEGQVYALRKFAREWCGKIDAKRAKRKHL
jgi:hypothetical protein